MHQYSEFSLSEIKATGWLREFLKTQAAGMTGNLDRVGEPFSGTYWDEDDQAVLKETCRFLGGLNSVNDAWVPFEQTGYWIDGMTRTAHLIDDEALLEKAKPRLYNPIQYIDEEGFIGPQYLKKRHRLGARRLLPRAHRRIHRHQGRTHSRSAEAPSAARAAEGYLPLLPRRSHHQCAQHL